jgi:ATP-dependent Clp protease ATP-binding subunit ClpA
MQRGFHPRLGARPLRDTIEKHLRSAVADATLAEIVALTAEVIVCGEELMLRSECVRSKIRTDARIPRPK